MKIKPIIFENIQTSHTSFKVNLHLDYNVTFIIGDSGTGKSALFSLLKEYATEEKKLVCFNYLDNKRNYKTSIKNFKNRLIVIDNADILLDDNMRSYIVTDDKNQYIIIGRNPTGLLLQQDEIYEIESRKIGDMTEFSLKKSF